MFGRQAGGLRVGGDQADGGCLLNKLKEELTAVDVNMAVDLVFDAHGKRKAVGRILGNIPVGNNGMGKKSFHGKRIRLSKQRRPGTDHGADGNLLDRMIFDIVLSEQRFGGTDIGGGNAQKGKIKAAGRYLTDQGVQIRIIRKDEIEGTSLITFDHRDRDGRDLEGV